MTTQSGPATAPSAAPIDAQVAEDPPANGKLTLISSWPRRWTTVAWATRRGDVCWATFRTPMQGATENVDCPEWDRSEVRATVASYSARVFVAWIRVPGNSFSSTDVTSETAYGQNGQIIARASNPP
jgi:hypothetical protein